MFKLYDVIETTEDIGSIAKGSVGTIIEIWDSGKAYEAEFLDNDGYVIDCLTVTQNQIKAIQK